MQLVDIVRAHTHALHQVPDYHCADIKLSAVVRGADNKRWQQAGMGYG